MRMRNFVKTESEQEDDEEVKHIEESIVDEMGNNMKRDDGD